MKIGIMGGVFDPPHNGHIESVKHILNKHIVDSIIVIPCVQQPLKHTVNTPYDIRLEMAAAAFAGIDNVTVSDIEDHLPKPSYTINTLKYLNDEMPDDELFLIMGYDEAEVIKKWHEYEQLKQYARFIIIRRDDNKHSIDMTYFKDAVFTDNEIIPLSSTRIREAGDDIGKYTVNAVKQIIEREQLYK